MKVYEDKEIQRDRLKNRDWGTHRLKLKYTFSHDLSHIKVSIIIIYVR